MQVLLVLVRRHLVPLLGLVRLQEPLRPLVLLKRLGQGVLRGDHPSGLPNLDLRPYRLGGIAASDVGDF